MTPRANRAGICRVKMSITLPRYSYCPGEVIAQRNSVPRSRCPPQMEAWLPVGASVQRPRIYTAGVTVIDKPKYHQKTRQKLSHDERYIVKLRLPGNTARKVRELSQNDSRKKYNRLNEASMTLALSTSIFIGNTP